MRPPTPRAALVGLALSAALGLGAAACTREAVPPPPAGGAAPPSSGTPESGANTIPSGASEQGSQGGQGVDPASP